ncbi:MAG: nuclear transport factor 2 family protein [Gammaproteobacteria bacterium]|nr:nuclear transport factor 2 family protein [Gammaproteobacteria bacterium]
MYDSSRFLSAALLSGMALTAALSLLPPTAFANPNEGPSAMYPSQQEVAATVARQDIEYLRRMYGHATDMIGQNTPEAIAEGLAIYQRIFTADAHISAHSPGAPPLTAAGPEGWAEVVETALSKFKATQHLIGSQLVTIESLPEAGDPDSGRASMSSHLHAWHHGHDDILDIFIGIYHDKVRYVPGTGWQIAEMELLRISGEIRPPLAQP